MKNRFVAALLACSFLFSMTACSDSKDSKKDSKKKKKSKDTEIEEETDEDEEPSETTEQTDATTEMTTETTSEATETTTETSETEPSLETIYEMSGDNILFGYYEQDGDTSNGPEPIEWVVLAEEEGRMLVISRYILDGQPYNTEHTDVTWETCSLRAWLNDDFYNTAFSEEEQARILSTVISNPDNAYVSVPGGNDTEDKLFLLSVDELLKYFEFNEWEESYHGNSQALITDLTMYAESKGVQRYIISDEMYHGFSEPYESEGLDSSGYTEDVIGMSCAGWWLRSPGIQSNTATVVSGYGHAGWDSFDRVVDDDPGVRPVMYITTE